MVEKLLARLKFQTELWNYRMTDRTKTICPPIFDLWGIKSSNIAVNNTRIALISLGCSKIKYSN